MTTSGRMVEAAALVTEVPRFTPAQWQRLMWDAGLKGATVHLFLRSAVPDLALPSGVWSMVVDTGDGVVDLEAFSRPIPSARFLDATAKGAESEEALFAAASAHGARIEVAAVEGRCAQARAHELVARAAAGVLRSTFGIAWLHADSGILTAARAVTEWTRALPRGQMPVELYATVRTTARAPAVVVDTLGLPAWDLPDLEIQLDGEDASEGAGFVARLSAELLAHSRLLRDGEVLDGPLGLRWRASMATASVPPLRAVLRLTLAG